MHGRSIGQLSIEIGSLIIAGAEDAVITGVGKFKFLPVRTVG